VIIGAGVAGLSAAWRLAKRGFRDFVVLEMESGPGGNSRWGEDEITAYPWAAHYVPVPGKHAVLVRELMEDLGVLVNGEWDERYLCHSPQERLYLHGRWQEGLEPAVAASARDHEQYRRFSSRMAEFAAGGEFRIPMTSPVRRTDLDRISMDQWLRENGFDSANLQWLVDYSCRDDFGAHGQDTSAWAGIHYFAARMEKDEKGPLTWPEGNGWIVRALLGRGGLARYVRASQFVHRIERTGLHYRTLAAGTEYVSEGVIFAAPTFLASYLMQGLAPWHGQYSPWLTANLTLDRLPEEKGVPLAWDNVLQASPSLGYVVATHQHLRSRVDRSVWTYYWALADGPPGDNRRLLLTRDWNYWKEAILRDLERAHPDIRACVSRIDIMRLGHAMIRPVPGFLSSELRSRVASAAGRFVYANSDLSGISIFEEAQYRGVLAADRILGALRA
jgi:hypothetical protein